MYKRCSCIPEEWSSYPGNIHRDIACKWAAAPEPSLQLLTCQLSWWGGKPSQQSPSSSQLSTLPEKRNQQLKYPTGHIFTSPWSKNLQLGSIKAPAHPNVPLQHLSASLTLQDVQNLPRRCLRAQLPKRPELDCILSEYLPYWHETRQSGHLSSNLKKKKIT